MELFHFYCVRWLIPKKRLARNAGLPSCAGLLRLPVPFPYFIVPSDGNCSCYCCCYCSSSNAPVASQSVARTDNKAIVAHRVLSKQNSHNASNYRGLSKLPSLLAPTMWINRQKDDYGHQIKGDREMATPTATYTAASGWLFLRCNSHTHTHIYTYI